MLKPTSAFVYVLHDASTSEEDACVALTVGVGEGDCVFCANELHDTSTITKIRNMDRFLTLILLKKCLWTKPPNALGKLPVGGLRSFWGSGSPSGFLSPISEPESPRSAFTQMLGCLSSTHHFSFFSLSLHCSIFDNNRGCVNGSKIKPLSKS